LLSEQVKLEIINSFSDFNSDYILVQPVETTKEPKYVLIILTIFVLIINVLLLILLILAIENVIIK